MRQEPSQTAILAVVIPIALAVGILTAMLIDDRLTAVIVGGVVGGAAGLLIHALVKYWLLRD